MQIGARDAYVNVGYYVLTRTMPDAEPCLYGIPDSLHEWIGRHMPLRFLVPMIPHEDSRNTVI